MPSEAGIGEKCSTFFDTGGPQSCSLTQFLWHEAPKSIATPPWMEC